MDECVWSNGEMVLTGENGIICRKMLCSVGGRWMDECGAMVKWYWQRNSNIFGEKILQFAVEVRWMNTGKLGKPPERRYWINWRKSFYSAVGKRMNVNGAMVKLYWKGKLEILGKIYLKSWVVFEWISVEQLWNDNGRKKLKNCVKNIIQRGW